MDNSKRAEKIHGTICNCTLNNPCGRSEWITSQFDEAVREACFKALDEAAALSREVETAAEKRSFKQGFALAREAEQRISSEWLKLVDRPSFDKGFASARQKAAGIIHKRWERLRLSPTILQVELLQLEQSEVDIRAMEPDGHEGEGK